MMLMGHAEGLSKLESARDLLLSEPVSELDGDEEADIPSHILYTTSFKELASKNIQYDTILWVSISLLLVLSWGIGIIMLLYFPFRRCVIKKDIASRKLYVTSTEIVYKVSRPSFIPFCGERKIEKHVPLSLAIDIIVEQDEGAEEGKNDARELSKRTKRMSLEIGPVIWSQAELREEFEIEFSCACAFLDLIYVSSLLRDVSSEILDQLIVYIVMGIFASIFSNFHLIDIGIS